MRASKIRNRRGNDKYDVIYLKEYFYLARGHKIVDAGKKFKKHAGNIWTNVRVVEDNFDMGAYEILDCIVGPTKDRPTKNWLQIKIRILKNDNTYCKKTFAYDYDNPRTAILEDFVREKLTK